MNEIDNVVKLILNSLSNIFRHIIPGVVIITIFYLSNSSIIKSLNIDINNKVHILIIIILAIVIGNLWYCLHRFTIDQIIDFLLFLMINKNAKDNKNTKNKKGYLFYISQQIMNSFELKKEKPDLVNYIHLRSSQIILLSIFFESLIIFSFFSEQKTIINDYKIQIIIFGFVGFVLCFIIYGIIFVIDDNITNKKIKK